MDAKRLILALVLLVAAVAGGLVLIRAQNPPTPQGAAPADTPQISAPAESPKAVKDPSADSAPLEETNPPPAEPQTISGAPANQPYPGADAPDQPPDQPDSSPQITAQSPTESHEPMVQWYGTGGTGPEEITIGSTDPGSGFKLLCRLTNVGAAMENAALADYFTTVADKRLYQENPAAYDTARSAEPNKYLGRYTLCSPVTVNDRPVGALAIGEVSVRILENEESIASVKVDLSGRRWRLAPADNNQPNTAAFFYTLYYGQTPSDETAVLRIYKSYTVNPKDYTIDISVQLVNLSQHDLSVTFDQIGPTGLHKEDPRMDNRRAAYGRFKPADDVVEVKFENRKRLMKQMSPNQRIPLSQADDTGPVVWAGATNKYFAMLMYLKPEERQAQNDDVGVVAESWHGGFYIQSAQRKDEPVYLTGVVVGAAGAIKLSSTQERQVNFSVYAGPKDRSIFTDKDNPLFKPIYHRLNFLSTIEFGGCFCTMSWLSLNVMWLLKVIAEVTFDNYGLAIIVLVLLVRLCLHPLTKKSQVSMMKMQKLQPQIQKLREKYADDKDTLNKEMMRVYKEQGATPLLGCLPMLLQMPILIALYTGINASVELRHAAFLPVWITDLAAPDALFSWSKPLPLIGTSFNLLPILLCVVMFLQTKTNPQMTGQTAASSQQSAQQAKMMKYMMPGMMLVFFYPAASGLTLYFMASTAAGLLDQWAVRRHIRRQEQIQAAIETTVEMPGKAARGHRPKKPKDPFKTGL